MQQYAREKNINHSIQLIQRRKNITTGITAGPMGMIEATCTNQTHAQEKWLDTRRILRDATQRGYHKTIGHTYRINDEIEVG